MNEVSDEIENPIVITPLGWLRYVVAPVAIAIATLIWLPRRNRV